ncbi:MAG: xanthine dehydrogenase family protein molybdopterin-binding subunit, partial [Oscillochloris sp.]|nr:xanthine dehydrogenase family protein molybdopterin-binding subunit [Oscillochloris sp.]
MIVQDRQFQHLGKPRKLVEGAERVSGRARYSGDVQLPGMLYGRPVLSPYAHARVLQIDSDAARAVPGVVAVLNAADLPTRNRQASSRQTTTLAADLVRYRGEPVVLVLATSEAAAADGAAAVLVDYEPLEPIADPERAIAPGAAVIWPDGPPDEETDLTATHAATSDVADTQHAEHSNLYERKRYERGDLDAALAAADVTVTYTFRTPIVHQGYLEPHAVVADFDPIARTLTVYTSTQGQFGVRADLARMLDLPQSKVTVTPMTVGGGFGAKYGILEPLTAAAAVAVGRPVRITLTRSEDFLTTTPSPASIIDITLGAASDGTLTALKVDAILDNGVYPFTLGGIFSMLIGGYYRCANTRIEVSEVLTHKPQTGAYRAPAAPQAAFALESAIDALAAKLQIDPLELRLKNAAGPEDLTGENKPWGDIGLRQVLEAVREHPLWRERKPGDGTGLAIGGWPCGNNTAAAVCRVDTDGTVRVHVGSVDISGVNS